MSSSTSVTYFPMKYIPPFVDSIKQGINPCLETGDPEALFCSFNAPQHVPKEFMMGFPCASSTIQGEILPITSPRRLHKVSYEGKVKDQDVLSFFCPVNVEEFLSDATPLDVAWFADYCHMLKQIDQDFKCATYEVNRKPSGAYSQTRYHAEKEAKTLTALKQKYEKEQKRLIPVDEFAQVAIPQMLEDLKIYGKDKKQKYLVPQGNAESGFPCKVGNVAVGYVDDLNYCDYLNWVFRPYLDVERMKLEKEFYRPQQPPRLTLTTPSTPFVAPEINPSFGSPPPKSLLSTGLTKGAFPFWSCCK